MLVVVAKPVPSASVRALQAWTCATEVALTFKRMRFTVAIAQRPARVHRLAKRASVPEAAA